MALVQAQAQQALPPVEMGRSACMQHQILFRLYISCVSFLYLGVYNNEKSFYLAAAFSVWLSEDGLICHVRKVVFAK